MSEIQKIDRPLISVVIPAHNAALTIGKQLNSLARQSVSVAWEVVVASNNSTDQTLEYVSGFIPNFPVPLRIVEANEKRGAAYARNVGVLAADGEVIAFCDADDEVVDGWVQAAWDALNTGLDVVTGYVHGYASQIAGPDGTEIVRESHVLRVPVPTCNCAVVREAFLDLGGFDESFNRYGHEDSEFSIRARLAGLRIGFYPPMQLRFSATEDLMTLSRKLFHSGQAEVRMWVRHPEVFPNQNDLKSVTGRFGQWAIRSVRRPLLMKERKHVRQGLTSFGNVVGVLKGKREGWGSPELIPPANRK